ncbi:MAG: serine/threonine-protein kinase, partial [Cyanobacteria bacterium P01_G01_bin.67]
KFKMSAYPDLSSYGYKIEEELGCNREGGRITWKALNIQTQEIVVIKQFCFAQVNSSWSGYKAHQKEIEVLQHLRHPFIPQYLKSLETNDGFYLIQKYIAAPNCTTKRQLPVARVKQIATNLLDILIYLQQQEPPILHRDIKPENILLDTAFDTYLIDFGFSRPEKQEISGSSLFKGTPGFIAPEQIMQPTVASDIYSLGITLVYLLTDKDLTEISASASADNPYQLNLNLLLPDLERQFRGWLKKMTYAKQSQRFPNALSAKQALLQLDSPLESTSKITLNTSNQLNSLTESKVIVGTLGISTLTTITVWSVNYASSRIESSIINLAIAVLAAVAIGITQLGAATIASSDRQAKLQGIALSVAIPTILVAVSSLIWGLKEAVLISAAIAIAEIMVLSYCWWQISHWRSGNLLRVSSWLGAVSLAIILGLQLI